MKARAALVLGMIVFSGGRPAVPIPGLSRQVPISLDLEYRALRPGEIIKVVIRTPFELESAHVRFKGEKFLTVPEITPDGSARMALIGLDLALEPGDYLLTAVATLKDGRSRELRRDLQVASGDFPVKHLRVDQKYVTPPATVQERIRRESRLLASVYAAETVDWLASGPFQVPVDGRAFPNFGERRIFNGEPRSPHSGVDISAPAGTPVRAGNSGRVVLADNLYFSGGTVIIDHGLGVFSVSCHFSRIAVKRGDRVAAGDSIGDVGATGRVTGPHLHWSVRIKGARVNPHSLLFLDFK